MIAPAGDLRRKLIEPLWKNMMSIVELSCAVNVIPTPSKALNDAIVMLLALDPVL